MLIGRLPQAALKHSPLSASGLIAGLQCKRRLRSQGAGDRQTNGRLFRKPFVYVLTKLLIHQKPIVLPESYLSELHLHATLVWCVFGLVWFGYLGWLSFIALHLQDSHSKGLRNGLQMHQLQVVQERRKGLPQIPSLLQQTSATRRCQERPVAHLVRLESAY